MPPRPIRVLVKARLKRRGRKPIQETHRNEMGTTSPSRIKSFCTNCPLSPIVLASFGNDKS